MNLERQLEYKCNFRGIELVVADRLIIHHQSVVVSVERIKKDLKLKDRVYKCSCEF